MIPSWWVTLILAFGVYRVVRLIGWDEFPIAKRIRNWATGAELHTTGSSNSRMNLTDEKPESVWVYRRPILEHFIGCPFCQGFWVSVITYTVWVFAGAPGAEAYHSAFFYPVVPFALSGVVGLIAKNLDP